MERSRPSVHLNDWCSRSGIDLDKAPVFPTVGTIGFQPPQSVVIGRTRGALISVTFDFEGSREPEPRDQRNPYSVHLEQRAWLSIAPNRGRWSYDQYDALLTRIRWFFGFAAGAQDQLLELRGETTLAWKAPGRPVRRTRESVWVLFSPPRLQQAEHRAANEMLLCLRDLPAGEEARPLTRWLRLCERLEMEPVFGPYFAALPEQSMYSDLRFLVFAQAAEAYDARRHPERRTKISLKTRVETLVRAVPRELRQLIPPTFADEIKNTRNFETHRDERNRKRAATGARLFALTELLKFVFDTAILRELGFSQSEIVRLVDRNPRVSGRVRIALNYMATTQPGR